jgi:hypothetical protein
VSYHTTDVDGTAAWVPPQFTQTVATVNIVFSCLSILWGCVGRISQWISRDAASDDHEPLITFDQQPVHEAMEYIEETTIGSLRQRMVTRLIGADVQLSAPEPLPLTVCHPEITIAHSGTEATRLRVGDGSDAIAAATDKLPWRVPIIIGVRLKAFGLWGVAVGILPVQADVKGTENLYKTQKGCFYGAMSGKKFPGALNWEGMKSSAPGDLLELLFEPAPQGRLTLIKNGVEMGVLREVGLSESYRFAVSLRDAGDCVDLLTVTHISVRGAE